MEHEGASPLTNQQLPVNLIAGMDPMGVAFQNPPSRNLGPQNKGTSTQLYFLGVGVPLFCGPTFRERGFWNGPPVGSIPAIKLSTVDLT